MLWSTYRFEVVIFDWYEYYLSNTLLISDRNEQVRSLFRFRSSQFSSSFIFEWFITAFEEYDGYVLFLKKAT